MTTDEKVDKIYAKVFNGLSENVTETRKELKALTDTFVKFEKDFEVYIASRGETCPFAKRRSQLQMRRKADVKYYVTTAIAIAGVALAVLLR